VKGTYCIITVSENILAKLAMALYNLQRNSKIINTKT